MKDNCEGDEFTPSFFVGDHKILEREVMLSMVLRNILDHIQKNNVDQI